VSVPADTDTYASASRGAYGGKLHLDRECQCLVGVDVTDVDLTTLPPSHREWCSVCGPDGTGAISPPDGASGCTECGERVGDCVLTDGVCLRCREDADSPRLVTDGGNPEHQAVEGGFECECGTTRQTPLGMARHRERCRRCRGDSA
jgi:hypothetical protein